MPAAIYPSFVFTVALLVVTTYFLLGGLPLLILRHDEALDARFVRGFFRLYYKVAFWAALGAALSFGLWGRFAFALGALAMASVAVGLRRRLLPAMSQLGSQIESNAEGAVQRFRRVHGMALLVNLAQLVLLVWGTVQLSKAV
jgi:hypothetical protein